jgi:hypothetical protein
LKDSQAKEMSFAKKLLPQLKLAALQMMNVHHSKPAFLEVVWILVPPTTLAVLQLDALLQTIEHYALVLQAQQETLIQAVLQLKSESVTMIQNVQTTELATNISVLILVRVACLVEKVHNVLQLVTEQFANAPQDGVEIQPLNVSNMNASPTMTAHKTRPVFQKNA